LQKKPKHRPRFSQPQPPHSGNNTEKERKQTREKKRNMVTPRETTLKATKKDPHVSGIKQKVTKQLKQQHPKPAGKRRGKENRETKKKTRQAPKPCGEDPASQRAKHNPQSGAPRTPPDSVHLCSRVAWNPTAPPPPQTPTLAGKGRSLVGSEKVTDHGHAPKKVQNMGSSE